jgi:hypothetical protein
MENKKDIPSGKATIIAALIAGVFGLLVAFFKQDPPAVGNQVVSIPPINQTVNINTSPNSESLCIKIKAKADYVSSSLDEKQKALDDLVPKKIDLLFYRDKLRSFSDWSCEKIEENYNLVEIEIDSAKKLLSNE